MNIRLLANSDTLVTIPFAQPAVFTGAIASITNGNTINLAGTPGWSTDQFVYVQGTQSNTYYAIIGPKVGTLAGTVGVTNGNTAVTGAGTTFTSQLVVGDEFLVNGLAYTVSAIASDVSLTLARAYTGSTLSGQTATFDHSPKEGSFYTVTGNGATSLTVNLNGDSIDTAVTAGTSVSLIPYWTLGTAFPASAAGTSYTASAAPTSRGTQILLPDLVSDGVNLSSKQIYYNLNGYWQLAGSSPSNFYNDTILPPSTYLTVRNGNTETAFNPVGAVFTNRISIPLDADSGMSEDTPVAVARPADVALNDLGLISSGAFAVSAGTSAVQRADVLLTYDNTTPSINRSALAIYYYANGGWRLAGAPDPTKDYGTDVITMGSGFTIRKVADGAGATSFWQNTRNY